MKQRTKVALIVETSGTYGRQILRGISRYIHGASEWAVFLDERDRKAQTPRWLIDWDGDGIICRITTPELAAALKETGIPAVDLNDCFGFVGLPRVASDMDAIGAMAARHLMERGFERIAYCGFANCGFADEAWSQRRCRGAQNALGEVFGEGAKLHSVFESPRDSSYRNWQDERASLCQWIGSLTFPVGIVACNDSRGQHVLDACRTLGVAVPEQVAVVGADNTETVCELCYPPLSSVVPDAQRIGFEAAALLARLINANENGRNADENRVISAPEQLYFAPLEVITRQSSDIRAVDDPTIARALQFIRERACNGISVEDVAAHVRLSRSTLERSFRRLLDCSPQQEIRRVRLRRVRHLLRETDLPLARIAEMTGYNHPEYLMVQFKKSCGQTPSEWRAAQSANRPFPL